VLLGEEKGAATDGAGAGGKDDAATLALAGVVHAFPP
jgi:hypothetical protein